MKTIITILILLFSFQVSGQETITSDIVNTMLKEKQCKFRLINDEKYLLVNKHEMKLLLEVRSQSYIHQKDFFSNIFDCDDFALILHAWIRERQYKENQKYPIAFGEVIIQKKVKHSLNFFITTDLELYFYDAQLNELTKYNKDTNILFIKM
ncbi:MAG: hypothetical protein A2Y66_01785 [Nitrospirae bacterium RBG_13_41_22]|nr:MAG: hypothetical protein A2Y66_01785 [Nitrospirae bacterium RBG_13_41_22]